MCNKLHKEFEVCPTEGIAWKLFDGEDSLVWYNKYIEGNNGWITWLSKFTEGDGFCMFQTREEAEKALENWLYEVEFPHIENIKKVQYREGLGICTETRFTANYSYKILIAKEFKVIKEDE